MTRVATGLDLLVREDFARLRGQTVGAIVNPTSVDERLRHLADLLHAEPEVRLTALLGPEHGVRGDAQDMIGVDAAIDRRTGVPVHSLYGDTPDSLRPRREWLDGLDTLIFDVQDVGSRYYTFAWTLLYAMEVAAQTDTSILVLDRPNPIGGVLIEGPSIDPGFESFVGAHPVPIRHGLTVGELARLLLEERGFDLDLEVLACAGYSRSMTWTETGLPWILPSPNMPTPDTASVYPGGCLIEGTNLSEGRGTTRPFELWGAPWLDPYALASDLEKASLEGVRFRPCTIRPTFHKHAGVACGGVQPIVTDPRRFRPVATYTAILSAARRQDPGRFAWRTEPYEFVRQPIAIDLLYGSDRERQAIEAETPVAEIAALWRPTEEAFRERRAPYFLYPED